MDFIKLCKEETQKKLKQLGIKTPKQKDLVTDAVFATTLNTKLE